MKALKQRELGRRNINRGADVPLGSSAPLMNPHGLLPAGFYGERIGATLLLAVLFQVRFHALVGGFSDH